VVIVGAGAAGLMAAARLREAGRSVRVIEARGRAGGRILTARPTGMDAPVELGAEFLHGDAPRTRRLLAEAGANPVALPGEAWQAEQGRVEGGDRIWASIERVLGRLDGDRERDRSFADFLRAERAEVSARDAEAAQAFVEGFFAADPERVSERALAGEDTESAAEVSRVPLGYDVVIRRLLERVGHDRVRTGRAVRRVVWRRGQVELETVAADGGAPETLAARAVIVTVPVGVLKTSDGRGHLRFDPPLHDVERALERVAMGPVARVTIAFDRAPWPELLPSAAGRTGPPSFLHTPEHSFNAFWPAVGPTTRALVAWAGGARSRPLPGSADELAALALDDLAAATGADPSTLGRARVGAWSHDWRTDPYSCGAYSYITVGGEDAPAALGRSVEGTVFLAGEALDPERIGTVEGALASGERAAEEVNRTLG
jgi:monoamine oxidase